MITRSIIRTAAVAAAAAALLATAVAPAFAHVTVQPGQAAEGGFASFAFKVPNEEDGASTTRLQVTFPTEDPIANVSVRPHPGWSYTVSKKTLAQPLPTGHGTITEVVSAITWTADSPATAIKPGEFDEFAVSAGPLPDTATTLHFPALQTYSNGDVVRWIETAAPGAPEPAHPAPSMRVTDPAGGPTDSGSGSGDVAPLTISIIALVVALGAAGGAGYLAVRRKS